MLGWAAAAWAALDRVAAAADGPALLALGLAVLMTVVGCWVAVGLLRQRWFEPAACRARREPWPRRITSWLAALFWSAGAVVWNVGIIGWLVRAADEGRGWEMVVLIPWSLAGWFLLLVLFAGVGVVIDSLLTILRWPRA
jgi:hypothetical protein